MKFFLPAALFSLALAAPASAQAPTAQQLSGLRLHDGFTLTYQVTVRDVRTPALRQKDVADQQAGVAKEEAAGHIVGSMKDLFEKQALELGQARPTEQFTITLSARDGKLLYLSNRSARDQRNGTKSAIVLDGSTEYESIAPYIAQIENDGWRNAPAYADENVDRLTFCPLPGVGLPGVDLIQSPQPPSRLPNSRLLFRGLVPLLNLRDGETPYKAGSVEAFSDKGRLKVVGLTVGAAAAPDQVWRITGFQLFQGHWLGTQMRWTEGEEAVADYQVIEARDSALDAPAFDIGSYLSDKANVVDNSAGNPLLFVYSKQNGTLKEQAEAARKK